jgi:hypothetical protein
MRTRSRLPDAWEQELGRVGGPAGDDDDVAGECLGLSVAFDYDASDCRALRVRLQPDRLRVREQRHVRMLERWAYGDHLGIRLRVDNTWEAVAVGAAHAPRVGRVRLVEHDPARSVKRVVARAGQIVRELLDARLVRDRRVRVVVACMRLGRILAARSVNLVELLRLRVVRLELLVGDRPRGRDAVVVLELAEVLLAKAVERGAVQLGRAADEVVHLRLERLALGVVPGVLRDVAVLDEDVLGEPVRRLAREPAAPLEEKDLLAGRSQVMGQRPAACARADDDHVIGVHATS